MKGKAKCKALKEIRKRIAEENDIEYIVSECTHQGDCKGTCPKCEAEVRYLEKQLAIKEGLGKAVAVAGVAASVCLGLTACGSDKTTAPKKGGQPGKESKDKKSDSEKAEKFLKDLFREDGYEVAGDIDILEGEPVEGGEEGPDDLIELEGDVPYEPEIDELEGDAVLTDPDDGCSDGAENE